MKIRRVKGNIIKWTGGDHNMYSKESIIFTSNGPITETAGKGIVYGDYEEKIFPHEYLPIHCAIHFRPKAGWQGEYGFDWMRMGYKETSFEGDKPYRDYIKGALQAKGSDAKAYYNKLKDIYEDAGIRKYIPWNLRGQGGAIVNDEKGAVIEQYYPSWLMLFPEQIKDEKGEWKVSGYENTEATLSMIADVQTEGIEGYELEYDKDLFELSHDNIPTAKGTYKKDLTFTIKCLKSFSEPQEIKVLAKLNEEGAKTKNPFSRENIVGKLKVLDNEFIYQPKIVLVKVRSNFEDSEIPKTGEPKDDPKPEINKYLKQSLMTSEIVWDKLDLTLDNEEMYYAPGSSQPKKFKRREKFINSYKEILRGEARIKHESQELQTDLLLAFYYDKGNKYDNYFKIFYIDEATIWDSFPEETLKRAVKAISTPTNVDDGRYCIIFRGGLDDKDTVAHELLHSMGLRHSFDDNLFIFGQNETDNIMDYDSVSTGGNKESPDKLQLWKWQIDYLRENAKNNKYIYRPTKDEK